MSIQPYIGDAAVEEFCDEDIVPAYAEAQHPLDRYYVDWAARAVYDHAVGNLSWPASRAKHRRECREALGLPNPLPPMPPARRGRVTVSGRAVADDDGAWLALGTTLFWASREGGAPHVSENLAWARGEGVDHTRVLCEATDWPPDTRIDPRAPGWLGRLREVREVSAGVGLRVYWTLFGGNQLTPQEQMRVVEDALVICQEAPALVAGVEISNEGNGFRDADGPRRMRDFASIFARHGYPTAITSWESGPATLYANSDAPIATEHFERAVTDEHGNPYPEGYWRPVRQPWGYWEHSNVPGAFINGEPIGIGSSVVQDTDPLRLACGAIVTWLVGGGMHVVHTGAGVYGVPNTHPVGGYRPANLWEQPTLAPTFAAIRAMRALLPADLPNWARQNHHWPGHPCTFAPNAPGDPSYPTRQGCCRAYAATRGSDWICLPIGVMGESTMTPKQPSVWTTYDPLTGERLLTGNGAITLTREILVVGRWT